MASHYISLRCIMNLYVSGIFVHILWILESSAVNSLPVAQHPVVIPSSNNLSSFMSLFPMKAHDKLTTNKITESCPQLWATSSNDFEDENNSGRLGYLNELEEQCYSTENMSFPCQGAIRISSYLCDASSSGFTSKKRPEPPKVDHPESLKNKTVLCNEMANSELLNNLCRLKKPVDSSLADLNCASQEVVRHFCNNSCHQENNRLCQMILQGFKTVIYWESLKETDVAGADVNGAEDNTKTTTKIIPDAPIPADSVPKNTEVSNSETIPKSNSFVQDTGIASKQLDKGLEMDEQLKLKKNTTDTPKLEPVQGTAPPLMGNTFGKDAVETVKTASELKTQPPPTKASPTSASNLNGMAKTEDEGKPLESSVKDEPNVDVLPQSPTQVFIIPPANDKKFAEDITIVENVSKYDDHYDMADPEDGEDDIVQPLTDGSEETNFGETRAPLVPKSPKPVNSVESLSEIDEPENTHFLLYFLTFVVLSATGYVLYQRRGRVFTFLVGGRGSRRRSSAGRGVNRSGSYKKLVNNLEEAMASSSVKNSNVIY